MKTAFWLKIKPFLQNKVQASKYTFEGVIIPLSYQKESESSSQQFVQYFSSTNQFLLYAPRELINREFSSKLGSLQLCEDFANHLHLYNYAVSQRVLHIPLTTNFTFRKPVCNTRLVCFRRSCMANVQSCWSHIFRSVPRIQPYKGWMG